MNQNAQDQNPSPGDLGGRDQTMTRALLWIGVAGLSAALAFTVVRAFATRRPGDPTSARIQQLIDEANGLLKALDDKRTS